MKNKNQAIDGLVQLIKEATYPCIPFAFSSALNCCFGSKQKKVHKLFEEFLDEAQKEGLNIKVICEQRNDVYLCWYLDLDDVCEPLNNKYVEYMKKFNKDIGISGCVTDVILKPIPQIIEIMDNAIKTGKAADDSDFYENAWIRHEYNQKGDF